MESNVFALGVREKLASAFRLTASCLLLIILLIGIMLEKEDSRTLYLGYGREYSHPPRFSVAEIDPERKTCLSPIGNVVYIKTHKTGSTTVQSLIYRYGLSRNLSFVVRWSNPHNGHVRYMKVTANSPKKMFLPNLSEGESCVYSGYNLSAIHVVHKKEVFETFMNPGTKYIAILRNPVSQLMSAFRFFNLGRKIDEGNSTEEKLQNYILSHKTRKRAVYGRNSQMFDLGLRKDSFENETAINSYITRLDEEFDLVLINEYFDESVVLLGRMLCWDLEDLMYTIQNNRSRPKPDISPQLAAWISAYNRANVLLYDHFNKTLWAKINAEVPSFWSDLEEFRNLQTETMVECFNTSFVNTRGMKDLDINNFCDRYAGGLFLFKTLFQKQKRTCAPPIRDSRPLTDVDNQTANFTTEVGTQ